MMSNNQINQVVSYIPIIRHYQRVWIGLVLLIAEGLDAFEGPVRLTQSVLADVPAINIVFRSVQDLLGSLPGIG